MQACAARHNRLGWWLAQGSCLCLLLAGVGCGKSGPKLYPVEGKVLSGGKPVTTGVVTFHPEDKNAKQKPTGTITSEGTYKLNTGGKEGAPPGRYKVTVSTMAPPGSDVTPPSGKLMKDKGVKPPAASAPVDARYLTPATSNLTIEVVESPQSGAYDLKMTR